MLPAGCYALAPATDTDRKAAAIDGTDRRTDGRTPDRYIQGGSKNKLLILSEHVNKTAKIGGT